MWRACSTYGWTLVERSGQRSALLSHVEDLAGAAPLKEAVVGNIRTVLWVVMGTIGS